MSRISELTLLYVEDDCELREQFVRVLKARFKHVFEAEDGIKALEMYEKHTPHMMVIDINLPKKDGLEVIEHIRKNDKYTPIVILSAYSDQEKLLRAMKLGLSDYLIKPVPHKKLITLLDEMALIDENRVIKQNVIVLHNGYFWNKEEKRLSYDDEIITLTKRERIFLHYMVKQVDKVITFDSLENLIWENEESEIAYSSLSHLLKRLRKKLPEELIENIYGEGYRISSM